jgi:hypothetical protein
MLICDLVALLPCESSNQIDSQESPIAKDSTIRDPTINHAVIGLL